MQEGVGQDVNGCFDSIVAGYYYRCKSKQEGEQPHHDGKFGQENVQVVFAKKKSWHISRSLTEIDYGSKNYIVAIFSYTCKITLFMGNISVSISPEEWQK